MYDIKDHEYRNLERFKTILRYSAPDRLLRYRRNVIVLGGFVLLYYLAGITVEEFSGGFIKGKILNPEFVPAFFLFVFLYNFFMFSIYLRREISAHNFKTNSLHSFGIGVAQYIIKREIGKFFSQAGFDKEYEPKNFSLRGDLRENIVKVQFTLDPEIRKKHEEEIKKLPGFSLDQHTINFDYQISEADKKFYDENKDFLRNTLIHEFMDFKFPQYFGSFVVLVIIIVEFARTSSLILR